MGEFRRIANQKFAERGAFAGYTVPTKTARAVVRIHDSLPAAEAGAFRNMRTEDMVRTARKLSGE
jgi:hypothetical protein